MRRRQVEDCLVLFEDLKENPMSLLMSLDQAMGLLLTLGSVTDKSKMVSPVQEVYKVVTIEPDINSPRSVLHANSCLHWSVPLDTYRFGTNFKTSV